MAATDKLHIPPKFNRSAVGDDAWERASAVWLINRMCEQLGLDDLSEIEMLDMGCGVKFTKVLVEGAVPIRRYVGVDVYREMIEYLQANVHDPRFEYLHIDARNDLYNPSGQPLAEAFELPVGERRFDLIALFSVFTHLAPGDYRTMLELLRRHVRPDGRLFFSLYINELTPGGHGLIDGWSKILGDRHEELSTRIAARRAQGLPAVEPFVDLDPSTPLNWAVYSREHAHELLEGTGWRPLRLSDPDIFIQHHFLCAPV